MLKRECARHLDARVGERSDDDEIRDRVSATRRRSRGGLGRGQRRVRRDRRRGLRHFGRGCGLIGRGHSRARRALLYRCLL